MCALAIGLVTALPLTYLIPRTAAAQTTDPEFDISIDYLYFSADVVDGVYQRTIGVGFTPLIDFDAFNPSTVAKIEYYEFVYYTDNQELTRTSHFIGANNTYIDDTNSSVLSRSVGKFTTFSRQSWFDNTFERSCSGYWGIIPTIHNGYMVSIQGANTDATWSMGGPNYMGFAIFDAYDDNESLKETNSAILTALENKQTIYLDVIRVGYTTFDDNDGIVVAYTNDTVIQHLELTKDGNAYTFGNTDVLENVIPGIEQLQQSNRDHGHSLGHLYKDIERTDIE